MYAGRAQLVSTEQSVLLSAVTAYMDVYRDVAVLELNENNVQVLQRQLEASQDRFRVGEITRTDVAQSEARLAGAVSARISSEATLAASRATYERVVGSTPGTLDPVPDLPPLPTSIDAAIEVGRDANPTVIAAKFNEESSRYAVKQAKGAFYRPSTALLNIAIRLLRPRRSAPRRPLRANLIRRVFRSLYLYIRAVQNMRPSGVRNRSTANGGSKSCLPSAK